MRSRGYSAERKGAQRDNSRDYVVLILDRWVKVPQIL